MTLSAEFTQVMYINLSDIVQFVKAAIMVCTLKDVNPL